MSIQKQFIQDNHEYLFNVMNAAPESNASFSSVGQVSIKALFFETLKNNEYSYLPFCLYYIHDGTDLVGEKEIANDEAFALSALTWLHDRGANSVTTYMFCYALRYDLQLEKCEELLLELAKKNFSPAFIALGELYASRGDKIEALKMLDKAKKRGHSRSWPSRRNLLSHKENFKDEMKLISEAPLSILNVLYQRYIARKFNEELLWVNFQFDVEFPHWDPLK